MTIKYTPEFSAFGPWVYEVNSSDELPRLYSSYAPFLEESLFSIKIPMNIDRRNATPDMHLYDSVIMVFESYILILDKLETKTDTKAVEYKVNISDIYAIAQTSNLLYGSIELYLPDEVKKIEYNTVSNNIINEFIKIIRKQMLVNNVELDMPELDYTIDNVGILYYNLINEIKKNSSNFKLVAFQKRHELTQGNKIQQLFYRLFKMSQKMDSVFLADDSMLICISRTSSMKKKLGDSYKYTYYYLPSALIKHAEILAINSKSDLSELVISIEKYEFKYSITQDSDSIFELANQINKITTN